MNMESNWRIFASDMPTMSKHLKRGGFVEHPVRRFFHASFIAKRRVGNERVGTITAACDYYIGEG